MYLQIYWQTSRSKAASCNDIRVVANSWVSPNFVSSRFWFERRRNLRSFPCVHINGSTPKSGGFVNDVLCCFSQQSNMFKFMYHSSILIGVASSFNKHISGLQKQVFIILRRWCIIDCFWGVVSYCNKVVLNVPGWFYVGGISVMSHTFIFSPASFNVWCVQLSEILFTCH